MSDVRQQMFEALVEESKVNKPFSGWNGCYSAGYFTKNGLRIPPPQGHVYPGVLQQERLRRERGQGYQRPELGLPVFDESYQPRQQEEGYDPYRSQRGVTIFDM